MTVTPTSPAEVDTILARAETAAQSWAKTDAATRARALRGAADALDAHADELVPTAQSESHLAEARLRGELARTTFQLRLFAEVVEDGSYLDARIDHADGDWPMGARPELRRVLQPLGPVLVFAASNFPFAFSVVGGDTASALAAGCSVVLKSHPGHPELSVLTGRIAAEALTANGAPEHVLQLIHGQDAGVDALKDPRIEAGAFTGSIPGGRALFDIAVSRPVPIPFFGEMGSVNPVFVTQASAAARTQEIADGFAGSFTLGAGQFCTKPGVLAVPRDSDLLDRLRDVTVGAAPMLNERIQSGYVRTLKSLTERDAVSVLAGGGGAYDDEPVPTLLTAEIDDVIEHADEVLTECFGPASLVVPYSDESQLVRLAEALVGQLTATIVAEDDDAVAAELVPVLAKKAGRVLWNQWPTGVSVTYAQQHGGPYPATTAAGTTSVGTAAITRFLRPVAYQGLPEHLLPESLRDVNPLGLPQSVDGKGASA